MARKHMRVILRGFYLSKSRDSCLVWGRVLAGFVDLTLPLASDYNRSAGRQRFVLAHETETLASPFFGRSQVYYGDRI